MKNKKLLTILGVTTLLVGGMFVNQEAREVSAAAITGGTQLYLTPSSNWKQSNARFAAYFFGNGDAWVSMADSNGDGIFEATSPADKNYTNVIFCRMNPGASANNWNNKWNQTSDLVYDGVNNHYTVKEGTWDKGGGTWSKFTLPGEDVKPHEELTGIVSTFQNNGFYTRETEIFLNDSAVNELLALANGFHNKASELKRTTYFEGDQLWMTGDKINSGYGTTDAGEMNHFKYENGVKKVDYTVSGSKGMEAWYETMLDLEVKESHEWKKEGEVYTSKDASLFEWFKAFTAPCYKGFNDTTSNYITFDHVAIKKVNDKTLELSLYANSGDSEKLTTKDYLFSKATVKLTSKAVFAGTHNEWNLNATPLHTTDVSGYLFAEVSFDTAGSQSFKIVVDDGNWLGYSQLTVSGITVKNDTDDNCVFTAEKGTYLFKFNLSNNKLEVSKI